MAEPKVGNVRVLVLYPSGEGKRFDSKYWLTTHYDLLKNGVWKDAVDIEFSLGAADSPYVAVATVVFEDEAAFNSAISDPGMAEVFADIPKYTNIEPVVINTKIRRNI